MSAKLMFILEKNRFKAIVSEFTTGLMSTLHARVD